MNLHRMTIIFWKFEHGRVYRGGMVVVDIPNTLSGTPCIYSANHLHHIQENQQVFVVVFFRGIFPYNMISSLSCFLAANQNKRYDTSNKLMNLIKKTHFQGTCEFLNNSWRRNWIYKNTKFNSWFWSQRSQL